MRHRAPTHRAAVAAWLLALVGCGGEPRPANLLLVSIDTCRADHLSAYGYPRPTSPFLEELAARGVLFESAFAQVPDTTPSHASLFTSTYPDVHGSANGVPLKEGRPTLAETLRDAGFRTAGFVSGLTMTAQLSGLQRGFEVYDDTMTRVGSRGARGPNERRAEETVDRALAWLEQAPDGPFFLFVHLFDPHGVYEPPPPYDTLFAPQEVDGRPTRRLDPRDIPPYALIPGVTDFEAYVARYDGEIRYVDDQLRRLHAALAARGLAEDTLIAVTSDHGENMGRHEIFFSHGRLLFDPGLHVPLILAAPGRLPAGRRVDGLVETIDIAPTLLAVLGLPPAAGMQGEDLLPRVLAGEQATKSFVLSRTTKTWTYMRVAEELDYHDLRALRGERWKLVASEGGGPPLLFDLEDDPGETRSVADEHPEAVGALEGLLEARVLRLQALAGTDAGQGEASEAGAAELLEELRALGYVR